MSDKRRPILYRGESYSKNVDRSPTVIPKEPVISFADAREIIFRDITQVARKISEIPAELRMPHEAIMSFQVQEEYAAKSYYPGSLFYPSIKGSDLHEVGTRLKRVFRNDLDEVIFEKHFYIRTTQAGIDRFTKKLNSKATTLAEAFQIDIRKISSVQLIAGEQKINVDEEWKEGRLEVTLHPFNIDHDLSISHFKSLLAKYEIDPDKLKIKQYYKGGLTFISMPGNRDILPVLGDYNPLRSVHPLRFRNTEYVRTVNLPGCPAVAPYTAKSSIVVGVIDGGYKSGNAALDRYTEIVASVTGVADDNDADHGALVTSAILHGTLNERDNTDILPEPDLTVRNFRVLSEHSNDPDLYDVIDAIELIVPANKDIYTYNISMGPVGQIIDTEVHRFTYALDLLSRTYNVLFNVAVGNKGADVGYNRIQSPSDLVNGMGVGAYTIRYGANQRADYSCVGPGREGNKLKPDILAFGGCERVPIQLLSPENNVRSYTRGTSFATPLVTRVAGRLIGKSSGAINALTAKALMIHDASKNSGVIHNRESGHGFLTENLDVMMDCAGNSYTLIYEGELHGGNYRSFTIPWIANTNKGKMTIRYTVAVQTAVDCNSPEDYTTSSVELIFYPNAHKFNFKSPDQKKNKRLDIQDKPQEAAVLEAAGWKRTETPTSESGKRPFMAEGELRKELRWDTVDTRTTKKMTASLKDPTFQIHAFDRGHRTSDEKIKFAVILSIDVTGQTTNLYDSIIAQYDALIPVTLQINNTVQVSV